jgi:hypothetical protein
MSRVTVMRCDGCGREAPPTATAGWATVRAEVANMSPRTVTQHSIDLCRVCYGGRSLGDVIAAMGPAGA